MLISLRMSAGAAILALGAAPSALVAVQAPAIRDNSFLVEEAYNQEAGVVQHAALLQHAGRGEGWNLVLAQEWPLWSQRHQASFTLPFGGGGGASGVGDLGLHYRFQLLGGGDEPLALAPRLSLLAPTGSAEDGTGAGALGFQAGIPVSLALGPRFASHLNAGVTLTPSSENAAGARATTVDVGAAASLVWLAAPWVNVLVEGTWVRNREVVGPGATARATEAVLSPGLRFAWNLPGGQQVVPGIAYAVGVGPSAGAESAVLVYLSFEHSFRRRLTGAEAAAQLGLHPSRQAR